MHRASLLLLDSVGCVMEVEQVLGLVVLFVSLGVHAVASSLSLCVANPASFVWLRDCDQEPCVHGLGLFGHWHS